MAGSYWNLNTLWFVLIAVLWMGFFFLEGFDFGVGNLNSVHREGRPGPTGDDPHRWAGLGRE